MEWMGAFPSYQLAEPLPLSNNSQALGYPCQNLVVAFLICYAVFVNSIVQTPIVQEKQVSWLR